MSDIEKEVRRVAKENEVVRKMLEEGVEPEDVALTAAGVYVYSQLGCMDCLSDILISRVNHDDDTGFVVFNIMHDPTCPHKCSDCCDD